jgi:hypothetical protein
MQKERENKKSLISFGYKNKQEKKRGSLSFLAK